MSNLNEIVCKINGCYVKNDCVQVSYPYNDCITILDPNGIVYHHKVGSNYFINKYLDDNRRNWFPYHNIPTFFAKSESGCLLRYTNQIFNFGVPYIAIKGNKIIELYVVKDGDGALLISKQLQSNKKSSTKSRKEIEEILNPSTSIRNNSKILYLDGSIVVDDLFNIADEDTIIKNVKEKLKNNLTDFREYIISEPYDDVSKYLKKNPLFLNFIEQNLSIENIKNMYLNIPLLDGEDMIVIAKSNGENIELTGINITLVKIDEYILDTYTIPINEYTYEQIKFLSKKITELNHPNIQLKHNPGVSKQDIESAKQMIYSMKRK